MENRNLSKLDKLTGKHTNSVIVAILIIILWFTLMGLFLGGVDLPYPVIGGVMAVLLILARYFLRIASGTQK
ncbi:hypothetical protein WG906_18190 [Pedobacter sp. P351]|uniref:hypothetical protein n=1 Tax=Pedobacter superstes TaxID=3133441 RepID=UPI0030A1F41C